MGHILYTVKRLIFLFQRDKIVGTAVAVGDGEQGSDHLHTIYQNLHILNAVTKRIDHAPDTIIFFGKSKCLLRNTAFHTLCLSCCQLKITGVSFPHQRLCLSFPGQYSVKCQILFIYGIFLHNL